MINLKESKSIMKCENCLIHSVAPNLSCCAWYNDNVISGNKSVDECHVSIPIKSEENE